MRPSLAPHLARPWRPPLGPGSARLPRDRRALLTLAIETSCDDTCVAVLHKTGPAARLLFHRRVTADSRAYGGIHPAAAVTAHVETLAGLVRDALPFLPPAPAPETPGGPADADADAARSPRSMLVPGPGRVRTPDFVSVTRGPGMPAALATGLGIAKGLAVAWGVPLVGVHHMQAHALTPRLVDALERGRAAGVFGDKGGPTDLGYHAPPSGLPNQPPPPAVPGGDGPVPAFPFLSLLVSGGHTLLLSSHGLTTHRILAEAANMAIGDLLDKVGRALAAPSAAADSAPPEPQVPFAVQLERLAFPGGTPDMAAYYTPPARRRDELAVYTSRAAGPGWRLAPPLPSSRAMRFDFSTLHRDAVGAAGALMGAGAADGARRELARETLRLAFEHVAGRVLFALEAAVGGGARPGTLVLAGGVAGSAFLRWVLRAVLDARGHGAVRIVAPPVALCTDNAAMIAWAGAEMYEAGWRTGLGVRAVRKWSLDPEAEDGGIPGAEGWERKGAL